MKNFYKHPAFFILTALAIFFSSQFIAAALLFSVPSLFGFSQEQIMDGLKNNLLFQLAASVTYYSLTIIFVCLLVRKFLSKKILGFGRWIKWMDVVYAFCGYAVYFVSFFVLVLVIQKFLPDLNKDQDQQLSFSLSASGLGLVVVYVGIVILPAIAEEVLCRGYLYGGLRKKISPKVAGLIVSGLFAAAHLQFGSGEPLLWMAAIDTFVLSLVLVYLREKTGSLWSSVLLHGIKNSTAFIVLFVLR